MANIKKIEGKTGVSYKVTVTQGRDLNGKQLRHYMTWVPEPKMTQRQIEKEIQRVAFEFERQIEAGFAVDNRQTFAEYADYVIGLKERSGASHRTIIRYRDLMRRINPAIGHIKLTELRPQHLNAFYANLSEQGVRATPDKAKAKIDLAALFKTKHLSRARVAALSGLSPMTITKAARGESINLKSAKAIVAALGKELEKSFAIEPNDSPLASKTVNEYHRLISTILAQAEKEMLVLFNAASKATPPKIEKKEAETFQPDEVVRISECLEEEPIKWKVATHLLLITGCRRGEIMGLKWNKIDWENSQIKIDRALLYSTERGVYESTTKTGTTRFIKLPAETIALLSQFKQWHTEQRLMNGDRWKDTGYLFTKDNGEPMHPDSLTDWLSKFSERHGLPNVHPHKFRHTMASLLYFGGVDSITISKRLGHAKVSTTTDIYSHIIKQADERASECIAAAVFKNKA